MKSSVEKDEEDRQAVAWIHRMAEGDLSALDNLYRTFQPALLSFFHALLPDRLDAEEVLQDTFVRAFKNADRFNADLGSPFSWLATIGKRLCIDRLRSRRRSNSVVISREQLSYREVPSFHEDGPHDKLADREWVQHMLASLPEAQRQAIRMAFFEGLTQAEIAESLQRPLGTVKSDLHRGLLALKSLHPHIK